MQCELGALAGLIALSSTFECIIATSNFPSRANQATSGVKTSFVIYAAISTLDKSKILTPSAYNQNSTVEYTLVDAKKSTYTHIQYAGVVQRARH